MATKNTEKQRRQQAYYEKKSRRKKIKLQEITTFTYQLAAMIKAGLPLVSALNAMIDQCENPVFKFILNKVKNEVSSGSYLSEACAHYPNAFPRLFISMTEAGEASGNLAEILEKTASYFDQSVQLTKKIKGAMTYPIAVIGLSVALVNVLLIFVIPIFAEMFESFGGELPKPTQILIDTSSFLKSYIIYIIPGLIILFKVLQRFCKTPKGRRVKDGFILKIPIIGQLSRKVNLSRFCRTYATLIYSGVPIIGTIKITSNVSGNSFIESACQKITKHIQAGGSLSEAIANLSYFPPMIRHMASAGERIGNIESMLLKVSNFYDSEVDTLVEALTSLMEPVLIVFLGVVIGGIVMAMFLPIFELSSVAGS